MTAGAPQGSQITFRNPESTVVVTILPPFLRGYPSSLALLARFALDEGLRVPSLKAALTASESLTPAHRTVVREAFGIEIFDHYGQAEISCMLHECESHDGMHVLEDYGVVELVPTGDAGRFRLIATNLQNTAMPLIRYDTGDIVPRRPAAVQVRPLVSGRGRDRGPRRREPAPCARL